MIRAILQSILSVLIMLCALYGVYGYKVWDISHNQSQPQKAEAIIVLTGGTNRIDRGVTFWAQDIAPVLYISGTNEMAQKTDLIPTEFQDKCCVILDPIADSTYTNAQITSDWVHERELKSIILVTSDYHMPRAELEFKTALPEAFIQTYSVSPEPLKGNLWDQYAPYFIEATKYWGAWIKYNL